MARIINDIHIKSDNPIVINNLIDQVKSSDSCFHYQNIIGDEPLPEMSDAQKRAWQAYTWGTVGEPEHPVVNRINKNEVRYIITTQDYAPIDVIRRLSGMFNVTIDMVSIDPTNDKEQIFRIKNEDIMDREYQRLPYIRDEDKELIKQYDNGWFEGLYSAYQGERKAYIEPTAVFNEIEIKNNDPKYLHDIRKNLRLNGSDLDFNMLTSEPSYLQNDEIETAKWRIKNWGSPSNANNIYLAPVSSPNILKYQFLTDSSPAKEAARKISEMVPSGTVYYTAYFPYVNQKQVYEYNNGKLTYEYDHVLTGADENTIIQYKNDYEKKQREKNSDDVLSSVIWDKRTDDFIYANSYDIKDDSENQIYNETEFNAIDPQESHNLWMASRLERLAEEYDPYDFDDSLDFTHDRQARLLEQKKLLDDGDIEAIREFLQMIVEDPDIQGIMKVEAMDLLTTLDNPQIYDHSLQDKESVDLAEKIDNVLFDSDPEKYINVYGSRQNGRFAFYSVLNEPEPEKVTETYQYVVTTLRDVMQDPDISYKLYQEVTTTFQAATELAKDRGIELSFLNYHIGEEAAYELQNGKYLKLLGGFNDYQVTIYGKTFKPEETRAIQEHTIIEAVNDVVSSRPGYEIKEQVHADWLLSKTEAAETHTARLQDRFEAFLRKDGEDKDRGRKI